MPTDPSSPTGTDPQIAAGALRRLRSGDPVAGDLPGDLPEAMRPGAPVLSEVFGGGAMDGAAVGFVLSQLPTRAGGAEAAPVLWIQDRVTLKETGRPYLTGMIPGLRVLRIEAGRAVDVLWAMEEGLRCNGLSAVIGEVWGDPPALDFTATKRLAMRAEAQGCPAWLIRRAGHPNLSAARRRWRVTALPSHPDPDDPLSPGAPRWRVDLFRTRTGQPGLWDVTPGSDGRGLSAGPPRDDAPEALDRKAEG